jgi:hypothetical protein
MSVGGTGRGWVLATFPGGDESVMSGMMRCANELRVAPRSWMGRKAKGHVLLFSTTPAYRWQNLGEFNMLANAILNFNDLPVAPVLPAAGRGGFGGQ